MKAERLLIALWLLGIPATAHAFVCAHPTGECFKNFHWKRPEIRYVVLRDGLSEAEVKPLKEAADAAFSSFDQVRCAPIRIEDAGLWLSREAPEVNTTVRGVPGGWPDGTGRHTIAVTKLRYQPQTGEIRGAEIEVNTQLARLGDASLPGCQDTLDYRSVLLHEVGHLFGLGHPCEHSFGPNTDCPQLRCAPNAKQVPVMWPSIQACELRGRVLTADDIAGLCFLYPNSGEHRACAELPVQNADYVKAVPLGCGSQAAPGDLGWLFWVLAGLWPWRVWVLRLRR